MTIRSQRNILTFVDLPAAHHVLLSFLRLAFLGVVAVKNLGPLKMRFTKIHTKVNSYLVIYKST